MRPKRLYLDYQATTPVDERVVVAMLPFFSEKFGNASSEHGFGYEAALAVDEARESLLKNLSASFQEESLIFTSGTTESNNLVVKGIALQDLNKKLHFISQVTEHKCILESLQEVKKWGLEVTLLGVDSHGFVDPDDLKKSLKKNTALVSIMHANNEIGTIQNIKALALVTHKNSNALFHTDAAQTIGKIPVDVTDLDVDLMTFSAHKLYGPKGVGALYLKPQKPKIYLRSLLHGGGHEFGLRSGTMNVPGIVGFAKAVEICLQDIGKESRRLAAMRNQMIIDFKGALDFVSLNGDATKRLPGNINLCFEFIDADELMTKLPNLAVASGSACSAGDTEPSYVIQALGKTREQAKSSLRIGIGRFTTEEDSQKATQDIIATAKNLCQKSLKYQMLRGAKLF